MSSYGREGVTELLKIFLNCTISVLWSSAYCEAPSFSEGD